MFKIFPMYRKAAGNGIETLHLVGSRTRGFKALNRAAADTIEPVKDDQLFLLDAVVDDFICEEEHFHPVKSTQSEFWKNNLRLPPLLSLGLMLSSKDNPSYVPVF